MKSARHTFDEMLRSSIENDSLDIIPDKAIEQRLQYHFMLKNGVYKVRANSFASFACWLFSVQSLGIKTTLVSVCMVGMLLRGNFHSSSKINRTTDTCQVFPMLVDSNYLAKDSTFH